MFKLWNVKLKSAELQANDEVHCSHKYKSVNAMMASES